MYGVVGLADALSACEFSEKLSGDDKQWVTEQIVKLLIIPKEYTPHYVVKPGKQIYNIPIIYRESRLIGRWIN